MGQFSHLANSPAGWETIRAAAARVAPKVEARAAALRRESEASAQRQEIKRKARVAAETRAQAAPLVAIGRAAYDYGVGAISFGEFQRQTKNAG